MADAYCMEGIAGDLVDMLDEDDSFWYQNELQLAAELGKTLLERNRELENQLVTSQQLNHDQNLEIDFLSKQVETLRELNQSKMKVYEEVDKNSQDIEKANHRLQREVKADKEKIRRLYDTVDTLESRYEFLQNEVETLKKSERDRQQLQSSKRRTKSVPSLIDVVLSDDFHHDYQSDSRLGTLTPQEVEIKKLQLIVQNLRTKLSDEQKKNAEVESELLAVIQENKLLDGRIHELQDNSRLIKRLEKELQDLEQRSSVRSEVCDRCKRCVDSMDQITKLPEHEGHVEIQHAELMKHHNGGSIYGSRESLQSDGVDKQNLSSYSTEEGHISLLSELDQQYHNLVQKYERLLEAKGRRDTGKTPDGYVESLVKNNKEVQVHLQTPRSPAVKMRPRSLPLPSPLKLTAQTIVSPRVEGEPEYKQLFRDIFQTLKRTVQSEECEGTETTQQSAKIPQGKPSVEKNA